MKIFSSFKVLKQDSTLKTIHFSSKSSIWGLSRVFLFVFVLRQSLLSSRLGTIIAYYNLDLPDSSDPPTSASQSSGITGVSHLTRPHWSLIHISHEHVTTNGVKYLFVSTGMKSIVFSLTAKPLILKREEKQVNLA